jgi:class 3 adenylate cyclase/tetratricopeptide (TPR) repeat protein
VVTVLFADLVGFTALSENRDPEQVKRLVDGCFERLVVDIEAFGGRVDKIVGDGILALFGAPIAHEDDAERAVRAALQLLRTVAEAPRELGFDARLRVGVNTGEVLVGSLAGGDYTAMGDVVNTAQRLQSAAEPGQVLVGQATHLATRRAVSYRAVGAIAAKGRDAPVPAWVAEEARLPPGYRSDRHRAPLIGRDDEVAVVSSMLNVAFARRRAALLLLVGDAGLGKSRLVEEVAEMAREGHDALILQGRCIPYGEANVWWPVAEAVRSGCAVEPGDDQEVVAVKLRTAIVGAMGQSEPGSRSAGTIDRVVDGLLHLLGFDGTLSEVDPTRARDEATRGLVAFAAAAARRRPLVVVLSDLHWADDAVLEVLGALLEGNARLPFVVLATARPSLAERWSPPEGGHHSVVVHLDPLGVDAAAELLQCLAGERLATLDDRATADLLDRASGNPFFLEELVSWLEGSSTTDLPHTLLGLVAARLDGLTAPERRVLEDAAVLGSKGRVEWLETMDNKVPGTGSVAGALAGLQAKDLLAIDVGSWEFRSELVRDVAYGMMTKQRRAKVHAGIASWMEREVHPHHDAVVDQIAHHYGRAAALTADIEGSSGELGDVAELAVSWLRDAGERAAHADTPQRAALLFSEALHLLDVVSDASRIGGTTISNDSGDRVGLLLARSAAYRELRDTAQARADAEAARSLAEAAGDDAAAVRAIIAVAETSVRTGAPDEAYSLLDEALSRAEASGDDRGRASALRARGFAALMRNDPETAVLSLEPAVKLYVALGDRRGQAWALQNLSWAHFIGGRIGDAELQLHDSAALFAELGDQGGLAWAMGLLSFTRFYLGYPDEAEAMADEVFGAAEAAGDRWAVGMGQVLTASIRLWTGRTELAVERAREAMATFDAIDDDYGRIQAVVPLGRALVTAGHVAEGFTVLEQARTSLLPSYSSGFIAFSAAGLLSAAVQIGDRERAITALSVLPAPELSSDEVATAGAGELLVARALLALQRACPAEALDLLGQVHRAAGDRAESGYAGAVTALALAAGDRQDDALAAAKVVDGDERSTYLDRFWAGMAAGSVDARRGDGRAVEERFAELSAQVDATGDRVAQALARLGWAIALGATGQPDAAARAEDAADRFRDLGIDPNGWTVLLEQAVGLEPAHAAQT